MNAATATSVEASNGTAASRRHAPKSASSKNLTEVEPPNGTTVDKVKASPQQKYRHVAAVHSQTRPSCLSHDSDAAPSFIGFRNLMVIVLGKVPRPPPRCADADRRTYSGGQPETHD